MWIRAIAGVLVSGFFMTASAAGAEPKPPGWQNCGVVRVHGDDGMVRLKVVRTVKRLKCRTARSLIKSAWRLPKPASGEVRPPRGWEYVPRVFSPMATSPSRTDRVAAGF
jgi:hypothetical protein